MEEQEKKEISINVSSGAEKVERVETQVKNGKTTATKKTVKKSPAKKTDVKKMNAQSTDGKAERESRQAKARVDKAIKKKEEKEKRKAERKEKWKKMLAEREALAEKRRAERKAKAEKRRAERKAKAEKRRVEEEEKRRARAHAKANKHKEKSRAKQKRQAEKSERGERKNRKSYGGWLTAVIALGVISLALGTIVTVGAVDMAKGKQATISSYRATTYELVGVMENVDDDLDRVRVSASPVQQSRILTDVLVQARLAEADLEKMPIDIQTDKNLTAFINRVAFESERLLTKLRNGETLTAEDGERLEELYKVSHAVRLELDDYVKDMSDDDLMNFAKKGEGTLQGVLQRLEDVTLPENRIVSEGAGMDRNADFSEKGGQSAQKIDTSKAEDLCKVYLSDYNVQEFQCIGETVARGYTAYNVQGYDDKGSLVFAEIDGKTGALLQFNYYEECAESKFDVDNAKTIAENFLEKLGYEDMTAVKVRENGTDADFTFVYEKDGVAFYPDSVKVKVCRSRGIVSGLDAIKYARNHKERVVPAVKLSLASAREKLNGKLEVNGARLAVVATPKGERPAYEFVCSYGEESYVVYISATTGNEIAIVNLKNLK